MINTAKTKEKRNVIQEKSFDFALKAIEAYKFLTEKKKEFVLSKQLLRSATSIGANVEEAIGGQSRKDFIFKLQIAYKETRETIYWLKLLKKSGYLEGELSEELLTSCQEIWKILSSIINTTKTSIKN